jgi:hypothetical protein
MSKSRGGAIFFFPVCWKTSLQGRPTSVHCSRYGVIGQCSKELHVYVQQVTQYEVRNDGWKRSSRTILKKKKKKKYLQVANDTDRSTITCLCVCLQTTCDSGKKIMMNGHCRHWHLSTRTRFDNTRKTSNWLRSVLRQWNRQLRPTLYIFASSFIVILSFCILRS